MSVKAPAMPPSASTLFNPDIDGSETVASGASAVWEGIHLVASTATVTGSTNITTATGFNLFEIERPTITSGSALTITNAATLYIANSPLAAGSATLTNVYALWVDDGIVRIDGAIYGGDGSAAAPTYSNTTSPTTGLFFSATGNMWWSAAGTAKVGFYSTGSAFYVASNYVIGWASNTSVTAAVPDTNLIRQAAGSLGLHNTTSTSAQLSIFNTRTDASNGEWGGLEWSSNVAMLRTNANGSGTVRVLRLAFGGSTNGAMNVPIAQTSPIDMAFVNLSTTVVASGRVAIGRTTSTTATSGTHIDLSLGTSPAPTATSTLDFRALQIDTTINYSNGTPGAGRIQLIRLAPTNTALPTGLNAAITLSSTANALGGMHYHNQSDETTNNEYVAVGFSSDIWRIMSFANGTGTLRGLRFGGTGNSIGFYGAAPVALQTGVAVSAAGIHAALVNLGLITA